MQVSLNWLLDFVGQKEKTDVDLIKKTLTEAGLEVESVDYVPNLDDYSLLLSITPNRADALSHRGVARELCAFLDYMFTMPMITPKEMSYLTHEQVRVIIETPLCARYACRLIDNVSINTSPKVILDRLSTCGVGTINNVVDATNYVMMALGQPMHAFDFEKLNKVNGRAIISVKELDAPYKFLALDGKEYSLIRGDLVITDGQNILALAGIIGGQSSAVSVSTNKILLESANFDEQAVRSTAKRLGITTDSSFRFERGVDVESVTDALNYCSRIILESDENARASREILDTYPKKFQKIEVAFRLNRATALLGIDKADLSEEFLRKKFLKLGIEVKLKQGESLLCCIPSWRQDITREIDLIEEAARLVGYDKIGKTLESEPSFLVGFDQKEHFDKIFELKKNLLSLGFMESINYAFIPKAQAEIFAYEKDDLLEIKNPLSSRYSTMRPSLIPGLLKNIDHNIRNGQQSIALLETGAIFTKKKSKVTKDGSLLKNDLYGDSPCHEKEMLSGVVFGPVAQSSFDGTKEIWDFYRLKGVVENILDFFSFDTKNFASEIVFDNDCLPKYFDQTKSARVIIKDGNKVLGYFGAIASDVLGHFDIDKTVWAFELFTQTNQREAVKKFTPYSKFPFIKRDLAFLMPVHQKVSKIFAAINLLPDEYKNILTDSQVFDVYKGKGLNKDEQSVAISLTFQSHERTLVEKEVEDAVSKVIELVNTHANATLRQ